MKISDLLSRFNPFYFIKPECIIIIENRAGRSLLSVIKKNKFPVSPFSFRFRSRLHYNTIFTAAAKGNILPTIIHSMHTISISQLLSHFTEVLFLESQAAADFSSSDMLIIFLSDEFSPPHISPDQESFSYPDEHYPLIYSGVLPVGQRLPSKPAELLKLLIDKDPLNPVSSVSSFCSLKMLNLHFSSGFPPQSDIPQPAPSLSPIITGLPADKYCSHFPLIAVLPSHFFLNHSLFPFFVFSILPGSGYDSFIKGTLSCYSRSGVKSCQITLNTSAIVSSHDLEPLIFALQGFNEAHFLQNYSDSPLNIYILDCFSESSLNPGPLNLDLNGFTVHLIPDPSLHLLYIKNILTSGSFNSFWSPSVSLQWISLLQGQNPSFSPRNNNKSTGLHSAPVPLQKRITNHTLKTLSWFILISFFISLVLSFSAEYTLEDSTVVSSQLLIADRSYTALQSQNKRLNDLLADYFSSLPPLKKLHPVVYSTRTDSLFYKNLPLRLLYSPVAKCSPDDVYFVTAALDNSQNPPLLAVKALAHSKHALYEYTGKLQSFINDSLPPPYKINLNIISVEALSSSSTYYAYYEYLLQGAAPSSHSASPSGSFLISFSLVPF